jgi:uridine kinase
MRAAAANRAQALALLAHSIAMVARPHPLRVAIDGRTAAGKTTLADELVSPVESHGRPVIRILIDDFHRSLAERRARQELPAWQRYFLDSFDYPAIRAALLPLGPGGDRRYRRVWFDSYRNVPLYEPRRVAPSDAVVLIDGVYLFRPELDDLWDVRLFVAIDPDDSLRRGPPRDQAWVGSVAAAAERYQTTYIPAEDHYITTFRPEERADVVIDNRDPATPRLTFRQPTKPDGR